MFNLVYNIVHTNTHHTDLIILHQRAKTRYVYAYDYTYYKNFKFWLRTYQQCNNFDVCVTVHP